MAKTYAEKIAEEFAALQDASVRDMAQSVATAKAIIRANAEESAAEESFKSGKWKNAMRRRVLMAQGEREFAASLGINPDGTPLAPPATAPTAAPTKATDGAEAAPTA